MIRCKKAKMVLSASALSIIQMSSSAFAERVDRGTQYIQGTRVNTSVYIERGYAIFENECGSQRLTQGELQGGAIPSNIIPCPRPTPPNRNESTHQNNNQPSPSVRRKWSAVAAGIDEGFFSDDVSVGHGSNYSSREEAEAGAIASCQKNVPSCRVVSAWNSGCYYITVSTQGSKPVAWGSGPTSQDAYNECYKRINRGNCKTQTLGGCYPE